MSDDAAASIHHVGMARLAEADGPNRLVDALEVHLGLQDPGRLSAAGDRDIELRLGAVGIDDLTVTHRGAAQLCEPIRRRKMLHRKRGIAPAVQQDVGRDSRDHDAATAFTVGVLKAHDRIVASQHAMGFVADLRGIRGQTRRIEIEDRLDAAHDVRHVHPDLLGGEGRLRPHQFIHLRELGAVDQRHLGGGRQREGGCDQRHHDERVLVEEAASQRFGARCARGGRGDGSPFLAN